MIAYVMPLLLVFACRGRLSRPLSGPVTPFSAEQARLGDTQTFFIGANRRPQPESTEK